MSDGQTKTAPIDANTFLILNEEVTGDFELTLQFKIEGGNSGIQYHSRVLDEGKFIVSGYQADIDATNKFSGILYEEKGRGILALRGQSVTIKPAAAETDKPAKPINKKVGKKKAKSHQDVEDFASANDLAKSIHPGKWNDYRIVVRGNQLEHFINDALTSKTVDQDTANASESGVIALQLHRGPAMTVRFKNITIRQWN